MALPMKTMTDYIIALGADKISHTRKTYLAHAIGVYQLMRSWDEDDEMCRAAMFHSIYGTETFTAFALPLDQRGTLRHMIGEHAERIAYTNSAMDRVSCYALAGAQQETYRIKDRLTGECIVLSHDDYEDLITVHLCDLLEQAERDDCWDYQRAAFRKIAERLGGIMLETYDTVFAREPKSA